MLHNPSVLESEYIEPNFWPEEIVFTVDEHKRTVLKSANGVHFGIWREPAKKLLQALQASRYVQIMLDVFIRVYVIQWFRITGLKTLEQTSCLLFFVRLHITSTFVLLWLLLQRIVHVFHWNPPIVISFFSHVSDSRK